MADKIVIKPGQIYAGELLSRDRSSHHKAVIYLVSENGNIYSFALTSEKDTIDRLRTLDPDSVVSVSKKLIDKLFKNDPKDTWIYCGEVNRNITPLITVEEAIRNSELERLDVKIEQALYDKIGEAVFKSNSYSPDDLKEMGFDID